MMQVKRGARDVRMADIPPQRQRDPKTEAQARAVYFNPSTAFMRKLPAVPSRVFEKEPALANNPGTTTSIIYCDQSNALETKFLATAPNILARYIVIDEKDKISFPLVATAGIFYVIAGRGNAVQGTNSIDWEQGDIFILPGQNQAQEVTLTARHEKCIVWCAANEPMLQLDGLAPTQRTNIEAVHYPRGEIERQLDIIYAAELEEGGAARAITFSSENQIEYRNIASSLSLAYNTLEPGASQRGHRHNAVAVTLIIHGDGAHSVADGETKNWSTWATHVTPPGVFHSHHNAGTRRARFLIIQDGGIFVHARQTGFSFDAG